MKRRMINMENKTDQLAKNQLKSRFIEMRAKGLSIRAIAKDFKLSPQTISNWHVELEEEIARLKAIELEALYEEFHLFKAHRLKRLGGQLSAIEEELSKRELSDVSTDKLLELQLKYQDEARKEHVEPQYLSDGDLVGLKSKSGTKMDSEEVSIEIYRVLLRYRAGLLDTLRANKELALLQAILKAEDQVVLAAKLDRLEALLGGKK
jgi:hypothetical protein